MPKFSAWICTIEDRLHRNVLLFEMAISAEVDLHYSLVDHFEQSHFYEILAFQGIIYR